MDDLFFMRQAIAEAKKALAFDEIPIGAIIVRDGQIIGRGYNRRNVDNSPFAHAEMLAISEAAQALGNWRLDGCTMYVTLEPCPMCAGAIVQCRLKRIVYGARDAKAGCVGTLYDIPRDSRFAQHICVTPRVLEKDCAKLLSDFFVQRRK